MTARLPYVQQLAALIKERCIRDQASITEFADTATQTLREYSPLGRLCDVDIIEWISRAQVLPEQARLEDSFGQPSLTLHMEDDFQIDALFWDTATTGIHQHAFSGAFVVLLGSSVHCVYEFLSENSDTSRLRFGTIDLTSCELLNAGDVRRIPFGCRLIHSVFHLNSPTITLVLRTRRQVDAEPEYVYKPPSIAVDPHTATIGETKRLQIIDLLVRLRSPMLNQVAKTVVEDGDIATAFHLLRRVWRKGGESGHFEAIGEIVRIQYGEKCWQQMSLVIREETRRLRIGDLRARVEIPEHRLLLAGLMNFPSPEPFFRLVENTYPESDPIDKIASWIVELSYSFPIGIEFDSSIEVLLRHCLRYKSPELLITHLVDAYGAASILTDKGKIIEASKRIMSNPFLRPLFRTDAWESELRS